HGAGRRGIVGLVIVLCADELHAPRRLDAAAPAARQQPTQQQQSEQDVGGEGEQARLQHQRRQQQEQNAEEPFHGSAPPLHGVTWIRTPLRPSARYSLSLTVSHCPRWSSIVTEVGCTLVAGPLHAGWGFAVIALCRGCLLVGSALPTRTRHRAQAQSGLHRNNMIMINNCVKAVTAKPSAKRIAPGSEREI